MSSRYESGADEQFHIRLDCTDKIAVKAHFHRNIEFLFLTRGEQNVFVNGKRIKLTPGMGLVIKPYQVHSFEDDPDISAWAVVVSSRFMNDYYADYSKSGIEFYPDNLLDNIEANARIVDFLRYWNDSPNGSRLATHGYVNIFFSMLAESYKLLPYDGSGKDEGFVRAALRYLEENYREKITLNTIASSLGYSRNYCSYLFNKYVGESFTAYLNRYRADRAAEYINDGSTVEYAMKKTGFTSRTTFYRYYGALQR